MMPAFRTMFPLTSRPSTAALRPARNRSSCAHGFRSPVTSISAESPTSFDDAVKVGIQRASQTLRNLRSAWVKEMEVGIDPSSGEIIKYQVNLKVVFVLE